jgi:predicted phosphate transport protein (TIGR00153 family)
VHRPVHGGDMKDTDGKMLGWFQALMPKEMKFFELFSAHAETLVLGATALREVLQGGEGVQAACAKVVAHEDAADAITREVLLNVRRSFITPFDRSDIQDLITSLDDAIDQMHKTVKVVSLFELREFEDPMREMADIIVEAAVLTREAVGLLGHMRQNAARLNQLTEQITQIEDRSDAIYDAGRKALFVAHRHADPMAFVVGVDVYSHLEKVMDRFEDVANRISGIVIEQV